MKEDYLWNKTGDDAEIEKLENSLKMFSYQETNPPNLPTQKIVLAEKSPNIFLAFFQSRFAFATLACLGLFVFLAVNVWLQFNEMALNNVIATEIKFIPEKKSLNEIIDKESQKITSDIDSPKLVPTKIIVKKSSAKPSKFVNLVARQPKKVVPKDKEIDPAKVLTKEELYAYNQLMTALAITSSKLKLVKDKAQSIEN